MTVHFTLCQKPWTCTANAQDMIQQRLCRLMHHEWFRVRADLERMWGRSGQGPSTTWEAEQFFGNCRHGGEKGYVAMAEPYGPPANAVAGQA
jgi:hypothetical protein